MNTTLKRMAAAGILGLALYSNTLASASAGGFITDILEGGGFISDDVGDILDGIHEEIGQPLDRLNPFDPGNGFQAAPGGRQPMQPWGAFCYTWAGRFGPGPSQPVGAFCRDYMGNAGSIGQ